MASNVTDAGNQGSTPMKSNKRSREDEGSPTGTEPETKKKPEDLPENSGSATTSSQTAPTSPKEGDKRGSNQEVREIPLDKPIVFLTGINKSVSCANPAEVLKELAEQFQPVEGVKISGKSLKVTCKTQRQAEKMLANKFIICKIRVQPSKPYSQTKETKTGPNLANNGNGSRRPKPIQGKPEKPHVPAFKTIIHGVPSSIPVNDLKMYSGAGHIVRLTKKGRGGEWAEKMSVVLTYDNKEQIPARVHIEYASFPTREYRPEPTRCTRCQKFVHTNKMCKAQTPICNNCGSKGDHKNCSAKTNCGNCGGDHKANDKKCPKYTAIKETLADMASSGKSFKECQRPVPKPNEQPPVQNSTPSIQNHTPGTSNESERRKSISKIPVVDKGKKLMKHTTYAEKAGNSQNNTTPVTKHTEPKEIDKIVLPIDKQVLSPEIVIALVDFLGMIVEVIKSKDVHEASEDLRKFGEGLLLACLN